MKGILLIASTAFCVASVTAHATSSPQLALTGNATIAPAVVKSGTIATTNTAAPKSGCGVDGLIDMSPNWATLFCHDHRWELFQSRS